TKATNGPGHSHHPQCILLAVVVEPGREPSSFFLPYTTVTNTQNATSQFTSAIGTYFEMKRFATMGKQGVARCNVSPIPCSFARPFAFICCGEKFRRRSSGLVKAKNKDDSPPRPSRGRVAKKDSLGMREEKRTPSFSEKRTR
uniref:Uncharacterized protein n=1 Tax=Anopheles quadriannulatus TaxID=34691 RepID=A0A182XKX8_ANOQN